jgi:hypothetical protein
MRSLIVAIGLSLFTSSVWATSQRTVNPVAGVETVKIEFFIGGPMHRDYNYSADLFRGSRLRAQAFEKRVREAIARRFADSRIAIESSAKHTMMVEIWGRPVTEEGCEDLTVAMISASFHDERVPEQESLRTWERNIIEVSPDESLEDNLEKAILQLTGEVLERGTGKDD